MNRIQKNYIKGFGLLTKKCESSFFKNIIQIRHQIITYLRIKFA